MSLWISFQQIGSRAYVSANVGSGTPQEASEWLEYMTAAQPTALAKERAANGHPDPYQVALLGIGNESWSCGGDMTPDYYVSQLKIYSRFVNNDNPAQHGPDKMLKIAVGPGIPRDGMDRSRDEGLAASRLELGLRRRLAALVYDTQRLCRTRPLLSTLVRRLCKDIEKHIVHG
jgi:hypothetical protein